jgi:hypothetical protein
MLDRDKRPTAMTVRSIIRLKVTMRAKPGCLMDFLELVFMAKIEMGFESLKEY